MLCRVEPGGTRLYVTGDTGVNWATVSFDASTGKQLWAETYDGPGHGTDIAFALAVSPDGTQVYVTGTSVKHGYDFTTIDYGA